MQNKLYLLKSDQQFYLKLIKKQTFYRLYFKIHKKNYEKSISIDKKKYLSISFLSIRSTSTFDKKI